MNNLAAYLDFELNISDLDGDSFTILVRSAAGEVRETAKFPYADLELEKVLLKIENAILRSTEAHRGSQMQQNETVETFGRALFDFVLPGEARSLYNECIREATHRHRGVRLKLSVHSPRLATLPWEFLYDPRKRDYICLNPYTPLVRYTELPQTTPPLTIGAPLRILGLVSDPDDMPMRLDVEQERQRVSAAIRSLEERGLVELTWLETNNWRELQRTMRSTTEQWHIFHFIGHGGYDTQRNEGYIVLGNDDHTSHYLYASQLARLLARQYTSMRLVLLNACDGARSGLNDALSSTAATLINSGIPAVLAMQYEITNDAAVEFANAFYEALADNFSVDAAVAEARNAISLNDARSLEWGVPVLHMRAEDGRLFAIADTDALHDQGLSAPAPTVASAGSGFLPDPKRNQLSQRSLLLASAHQVDAPENRRATETITATYVSQDDLTKTLSQAIAERNAGPAQPEPLPTAPIQWWEIVETIDSIDETVASEASARMQWAAAPELFQPAQMLAEIAQMVRDPIRQTDPQVAESGLWEDDPDDEFHDELYDDLAHPADLGHGRTNTAPNHQSDDRMHVVKAALADRHELFTESVDPLDVRMLLNTYVHCQHLVVGFDWVTIPAGEFIMGSMPGRDAHMFADESPQFSLFLDDFRLSRFPVTNAQYKLFVVATGYAAPSHWINGNIPRGEEDHPVVNVNWQDASEFCEWAGVRLPTEAEWEKGARGTDGRIYPWGNEQPDATRCNFDHAIGMTVPVGSYPTGASPYGLWDMAGNVWEWTASVWLNSYENYQAQIENNLQSTLRRVLRGGGFREIEFVRCASRSWDLPNQRYRDLGFRVAAL